MPFLRAGAYNVMTMSGTPGLVYLKEKSPPRAGRTSGIGWILYHGTAHAPLHVRFTPSAAAGTAAALSLKENVAPRSVDVSELQRILVRNGLNIGQGFRKLPALEKLGDADYSGFNEKLINGNG